MSFTQYKIPQPIFLKALLLKGVFRASIHARERILILLAAKNTTSIACPISERYCRLALFAILRPAHLTSQFRERKEGRRGEREREKERERKGESKRDQVWNVLCTAPLLYYVNGIVIHTG